MRAFTISNETLADVDVVGKSLLTHVFLYPKFFYLLDNVFFYACHIFLVKETFSNKHFKSTCILIIFVALLIFKKCSMKKILFLVVACVFSVVNSHAQFFAGMNYEILAGFNGSYVSDPFKENILGINLGVKASKTIQNWGKSDLYGQAALLFSMKGGKDDNDIDALVDDDKRIRSNYLELPVHLGYSYSFNDKVAVFVDAGPYVAYGIGGNHFNSDNEYFSLNRFDAGFGYGFGVKFKKRFAISANMNMGFVNLKKGDVDYKAYEGKDKWYNTNAEISFHWILGKKNKL